MAKNGSKLLEDACLWRCIAHLYVWGRNCQMRSRLVCIFHAANYMFETGSLKGSISLEDWHTHVFQPFYMSHYAASTWFGVSQRQIGAMFDFSRKEGGQWVQFVIKKLKEEVQPQMDEWVDANVDMNSIQTFKDRIRNSVRSEESLLRLVAHSEGIQKGLNRYLAFYLFNTSTDQPVLDHCKKFIKEMGKAYLQILSSSSTTMTATTKAPPWFRGRT